MCTTGSTLEDREKHEQAHEEWSRRQFMKVLALGSGAATLGLNGIPVRASTSARLLEAVSGSNTDRVLVLIQLSGGNDGLNTVIPVGNDLYHTARPRIGIRDTDAVMLASDLGLHPSLSAWQSEYGDGRLSIVQNVGYERPELSHFVSTDVWLSADAPEDPSGTGWLGRYLQNEYPSFDSEPPEHPIALQIGSASPLLLQGSSASMGVNFPSLSLLNRLTEGGTVFAEDDVPASRLGEQLAFVRRVSNNSFSYAKVIKGSYDSGSNRNSYAGDSLARNLATVARLIRGGLGSRIYHVTMGGFDTHANQAGGHATLLRWLGDATAAFMRDLAVDGLDERVMAMTFSEFGRRIRENSSAGTDHGTAAPLFVLGGGIAGGLIGDAPDLANVDPNGNLRASIDFRSVYATILREWLGVDEGEVAGLLGQQYPSIGLFGSSTGGETHGFEMPASFGIEALYPNPARQRATLELALGQDSQVHVSLVDLLGRVVAQLVDTRMQAGQHRIPVELPTSLPSGPYLVRVNAGARADTRTLIVTD